MLTEMQSFVNWVRRRNPDAHTWRDYRCDLTQFHAFVGEIPLYDVTFKDIVSNGLKCPQITGIKSPLFTGLNVHCQRSRICY